MQSLPIEAIRTAFLAMDDRAVELVADLLGGDEVDQMIACVVEAQIAAGWTLLPPALSSHATQFRRVLKQRASRMGRAPA